MKKIYSFLLATLVVTGLSAQTVEITGAAKKDLTRVFSASNKVNTPDTLTVYLDRATAFYILTAGASGYVLGTSDVSSETGQHYDAVGNALVNEAMVYFVHKEIMGGTADDITVNVYNVGPDSLPTTLLGDGTVNANDADTTGFPTFIALNNTTYSSADFLVSVNYGSIDDTIALFSTNPTTNSGGPDGAGEMRCKQFVTTLTQWAPAAAIWTIGGNAFDADALVIPILDVTGVDVKPAITKDFSLYGAYPNPAVSSTTIRYTLETSHSISIRVFDNKGRVVAELPASMKNAGENEAILNVSDLAAGKYYYTISSENTSLTSKFVVVK